MDFEFWGDMILILNYLILGTDLIWVGSFFKGFIELNIEPNLTKSLSEDLAKSWTFITPTKQKLDCIGWRIFDSPACGLVS